MNVQHSPFIFAAIAALVSCNNPTSKDIEDYQVCCPVAKIELMPNIAESGYCVEFNKEGNLTGREVIGEDGSLAYSESYEYDSKGRRSIIQIVGSDGDFDGRYEYQYDGRFVRDCSIYGNANYIVRRFVHENDGRHIVKTTCYEEDELQHTTVKVYGNGYYDETSFFPDSSVMGKARITFTDEKHITSFKGENLDAEIRYNSKGLPEWSRGIRLSSANEPMILASPETEIEYTYEYDDRGNWIVRNEYQRPDSVAIVVLKRELTY